MSDSISSYYDDLKDHDGGVCGGVKNYCSFCIAEKIKKCKHSYVIRKRIVYDKVCVKCGDSHRGYKEVKS